MHAHENLFVVPVVAVVVRELLCWKRSKSVDDGLVAVVAVVVIGGAIPDEDDGFPVPSVAVWLFGINV